MSKRIFRGVVQASRRRYPTLETFDRQDRRSFLARLGAAVLGAGSLAALSACSGRSVGSQPDMGHPPGAMPAPDARVDGEVPEPDGPMMMGVAPAPDSRTDVWTGADGATIGGGPRIPDAAIDKSDLG